MKMYYDRKDNSFNFDQNVESTRYEIDNDKRNDLFNELNSHSTEDNLYGEWKIVPDTDGKPIVRYVERDIEELKKILRRLRNNRVFPIINRSNFWYNSLTQQQKDDLQLWYKKWLDVTETLVIPERPTWLE